MVFVAKGASAGKTGKVLHVDPERGRALVEGVRLVKKHLRKSQENPRGKIADKEAPVAVANLQLYCPNCKKGVRVSRAHEGDSVIRKCRRCSHAFDR